jgi:FMNH2-dependent dimethyl sulfone monooxygenase
MGLEFHLAAARWVGHGGEIKFHESVMEAMTAVPAAAAITKNILGLATGHVTYGHHPLHYAKFGATADQISGGRWGLNIVNGWVADEQALFGQSFPDHEVRYDMADEFITLMKHAWFHDEPFTFEGDYYQSYGAYIDPKPIRKPRPFLVNAGSSPTGIDFAARHCDWLFCLGDLETVSYAADSLKEKADIYEREVESFTFAWLLQADTNAEAQRAYREVVDGIDHEAVETFLLRGMQGSQSGQRGPVEPASTQLPDAKDVRGLLGEERYNSTAIGLGGRQMVGNAEAIAEQLREFHLEGGQRGIMLSFLDYEEGLQRLQKDVLPILQKMGLRT